METQGVTRTIYHHILSLSSLVKWLDVCDDGDDGDEDDGDAGDDCDEDDGDGDD